MSATTTTCCWAARAVRSSTWPTASAEPPGAQSWGALSRREHAQSSGELRAATPNTAPPGAATTAPRPKLMSFGGIITEPPSDVTRSQVASQSATVNQIDQNGGSPSPAVCAPQMTRPPSEKIAGARVFLLDLPAEHRAVEGGAGREVVGGELVPAEAPDVVDPAGTDVVHRLPRRERRSLVIGEHRHAAAVEDVHRRHHGRSTGGAHGLGGRVDVGDRHVERPVVGHSGGHRGPAPGHAHPIEGEHRVAARLGFGRDVGVPSEDLGIEGSGPVDVGHRDIDPARHTGFMRLTNTHRRPPQTSS